MWSRRVSSTLICKNIKPNVVSKLIQGRYSSTQLQEAVKKDEIIIERTPKPRKVRTPKKFKEPFPKSFFAGKCDPEVLEYPEVIDQEEISAIQNLAKNVEQIMQNVNISKVDETGQIPPDIFKQLGSVKACGLKIPWNEGGLGYTDTECTIVAEALAADASISKYVLEQQRVSCLLLQKYGSSEQKERYLKSVINGDKIISCAYLEDNCMADTFTPMKAVAVSVGGGYELSGEKTLVYNASNADVFIVFVAQPVKAEDGSYSTGVNAFLVDSQTPGFKVHSPQNMFAVKGGNMCKVTFNNAYVPKEAMLGKPNDGLSMMMNVVGNKFAIAPRVVGVTKKLVTDVTRHCINNSLMGKTMTDMEFVKASLGEMSMLVYALESSAYLQAGIADSYENPDSFLETCILKVLASQTMQTVVGQAVTLLGFKSCNPEFQYLNRLIRETHYHSVFDEADFILKMTISMNGLHHAGTTMYSDVKKMRNPLLNPWYVLRKKFKDHRDARNRARPTLGLGFDGYLHPSLTEQAEMLEYCVECVQRTAERMFYRYGQDLFDQQMELTYLADMTVLIYSLIATLGRASRSYCIGLSEADMEIEIALAYTLRVLKAVSRMYDDIEDGPVSNNTNKCKMIADRLLANKGDKR